MEKIIEGIVRFIQTTGHILIKLNYEPEAYECVFAEDENHMLDIFSLKFSLLYDQDGNEMGLNIENENKEDWFVLQDYLPLEDVLFIREGLC